MKVTTTGEIFSTYCFVDNVSFIYNTNVFLINHATIFLDEPIISGFQDHNIAEGSDLMIVPNIEANPDPISVWWTRQHETGFVNYGTNLTIRRIERKFSDNFTCHVMNTITIPGKPIQNRTTEEIFKVNVQCKYKYE